MVFFFIIYIYLDLQFSTDEEDDFENVGIEASTSALEQNEIQADTDMAQTSFGSIGLLYFQEFLLNSLKCNLL